MKRDIAHIVSRALRVRARGGVRNDRLTLLGCTDRVSVVWAARDTHPWDDDLPDEEKTQILLEQALADTDAVLENLLRELPPEIEEIEIAVVTPGDRETLLAAGTIERSEASLALQPESLRMRLLMLGIRFGSRLAESAG